MRAFRVCRWASTLSPAVYAHLKQLSLPQLRDGNPGSKEEAFVSGLTVEFKCLQKLQTQIHELQTMVQEETDKELIELAQEEAEVAKGRLAGLEQEVRDFILQHIRPQEEDVDALELQVRAAAGGTEAGLFACDMFQMYNKFCSRKGWAFDICTFQADNIGGTSISEAVARVSGPGAYAALMWEAGVHRVQRVPSTEKSGRMHTSTVTVTVMPEMPNVNLVLDEKELKFTTFRPGGPGGQNVDKSDSGSRVVHIPTGLMASIVEDRSYMQNRKRAMEVLAGRVYNFEQKKLRNNWLGRQRAQQGTGDRSEKIRTYNFPAARVVDHRSGLTVFSLPEVLQGDLDELVDAMMRHHEDDLLVAWAEGSDPEPSNNRRKQSP
eukprot:GGOE01040986.1.p1 GENE.GGOE01040986.1~~GGOE01040986.1.p1  ORF type:complete len:378 (-),score=72.57 GGOE01040986.1:201-1334(-)